MNVDVPMLKKSLLVILNEDLSKLKNESGVLFLNFDRQWRNMQYVDQH